MMMRQDPADLVCHYYCSSARMLIWLGLAAVAYSSVEWSVCRV